METINGNTKSDNMMRIAATTAAESAPAAQPGRSRVSTTFLVRYKDDDLSAIIAAILNAMTDNTAYPSPAPTLAALATAGDAFTAAVQANDGGATAVVRRDQARAAVEVVLRELAAYVQHASKGDKLALMSSGFPVQRQRGASVPQPIVAPTGLKVRRGLASGQVAVRCSRVPTARVYEWRFASVQTPTAWTLSDTTSATSSVLGGFVAGTQYLLQVRAHGRRGASDWSHSASLIAA